MGESDFSKKKELCYKYYEELKEELLTDRIDFCLREFYKRMYNNFIFMGYTSLLKLEIWTIC